MKKILLLSDLQIPDHSEEALELVLQFIPDFRPNLVILNGDLLNFTGVAKYDPIPHYTVTLSDEIETARRIINKVVKIVRQSNPIVEIVWIKGNHEFRLEKFLATHATPVAELKIDGEYLISIEKIFNTKELGIKTVPYQRDFKIGDVIVEHGDLVRKHAGYTAKGMFESRGESGISGHTHRAGYYSRTRAGKTYFWIEQGCLCNLEPEPHYARRPDWAHSFVIAYQNKKQVFPQLIPIFNNSFVVNGKLYSHKKYDKR